MARLFCYYYDMLNIIYTNTTVCGQKSLLLQLQKNNTKHSKHIFIVPDRFTLGVEKEICQSLGGGSFNTNVYSVTRLAVKMLGQNVHKCLSKEGTVMLLSRIIKQNNELLGYYKDIASYQFSQQMFAAIASLRNSNISVEQIKTALPNMQGEVAQKLADIAIIYEKYLQQLSTKYIDTITRVDALISNISNIAEINNSHIYILGFNIYSNQQLSLIKELCLYCPSVSLSITHESFGSNKDCFPYKQIEEVISFCKDNNIAINKQKSYQTLPQPFDFLHKNMFGFAQDTYKSKQDNIVLFAENNAYEEIKAVAREINFLVKQNKFRYKDISVVCNNIDYLPIVSEIFDRCDIPYFLDKKYYVKNSLLVKYIFCLYSCVSNKYLAKEMLKLLHHPFANIDTKNAIIFENYVKQYNINYSLFLQPFRLGDCAQAEVVRKKLINQLLLVPKDGYTVSQNCDFITNVIAREDIVKVLDGHKDSLDESLVAGSYTEDFVSLIQEIAQLIGQDSINTKDFYALLRSATHDMSISLLPRYVDTVFVGDTTQSRFNEQKAIFIVGANRTFFPLQKGDNIIFSAINSQDMKNSGLNLFPSPIEFNNFEQFVIIDLLTKSEKVYIGHSMFGLMGERLDIGEGVREIAYLLNINYKKIMPLIFYKNISDEQKIVYNLINAKNAYYEYMFDKIPHDYKNAVREFLLKTGYNLHDSSRIEDKVALVDIFAKADNDKLFTSVSQLETYFACPFRHYLQYGLKLKEEINGMLAPNIIGQFVHNVLENYFKKNHLVLKTIDNYQNLIDNAITEEMEKEQYACYLNNGMNVHILNNLCNECYRVLNVLTQNYQKSLFTAKFFEHSFGYDDSNNIEIVVGDTTFKLRGKIDRVDEYKNHVAIIDYKTGSAKMDFKEIFYGRKIQLYVYLRHFLDTGYEVGGVFYLPISSGYSKEGKFYKLDGHILDSLEIYNAIDGYEKTFLDNAYQSRVLNMGLKQKNEEISIATNQVLSQKDFYQITNYVFELLSANLQPLLDGNIDKCPLDDACEYCSYKNLCGDVPKRQYSAKKIADFYSEEQQ